MNLPDIQTMLSERAQMMSNDDLPTTLDEKVTSAGMQFTLKTKRARHAAEGIVRGAPGLHTLAVLATLDGSSLAVTPVRKIVDLEHLDDDGRARAESIEDVISHLDTLEGLTTLLDNWTTSLHEIENISLASQKQAARETRSSSLGTSTKKKSPSKTTKPTGAAKKAAASKRTAARTSTPASPARDEIAPGYSKVYGEYTDAEIMAMLPAGDPRKAWHPLARGLATTLPKLTRSRSKKPIVPCVIPTITMRCVDGGMLRVNACGKE